MRFLALVKHYIINLEFLNSPSFPQGPELIVILCILPLFTCRPFSILFKRLGPGPTNSCSAFPSSCFYRRSLNNVQTTACLSSFKCEGLPGFWGTREHWQNIEGNKGTLAIFWEQGNKIRKITKGNK